MKKLVILIALLVGAWYVATNYLGHAGHTMLGHADIANQIDGDKP